jgi:hypothetical protein
MPRHRINASGRGSICTVAVMQYQADPIRHLIDLDAHRYALRKPHPFERSDLCRTDLGDNGGGVACSDRAAPGGGPFWSACATSDTRRCSYSQST